MAGKVALVTGASAGIGRACARAFAERGAAVAVADVDTTRGEAVAHELGADGTPTMFVRADVSVEADVEAMVQAVLERFERLDFACNNAGIEGATAQTPESTTENWDRVLAVNLTGTYLCLRAELRHMLERGHGAIVNIASVAGLVGFAGIPAYTASKHGIVGLTRTAALECAPTGIRINAVCPGVVQTEMIDRFTHGDPAARAELLETEPVGRLGRPEEIADAVVWLCSPQASFVTGQAIAVDGGFVSR